VSAQMTSADNALSAAINVVSNAVSAETVNRVSVDGVLSLRITSVATVTLTGDVGGTGAGSISTTISVAAVNLQKVSPSVLAFAAANG